ncbi:MAG: glycosyltransferase [Eubacteriales bacterium]
MDFGGCRIATGARGARCAVAKRRFLSARRKILLALTARAVDTFDFISVRDRESQKLLATLLPGRVIHFVSDPTFVLFGKRKEGIIGSADVKNGEGGEARKPDGSSDCKNIRQINANGAHVGRTAQVVQSERSTPSGRNESRKIDGCGGQLAHGGQCKNGKNAVLRSKNQSTGCSTGRSQSQTSGRASVNAPDGEVFSEIVRYFEMSDGQKRALGEYSKRIVEKYYSAERMARRTLDVYRSLMKLPTVENQWKEGAKMKILMLIDSLEVGGAETHVETLARELCALGCGVAVASGGGEVARRLAQNGVRHIRFPGSAPASLFASIFAIIARENPDVVHAHTRKTAFCAHFACKALGIPLVMTAHARFSMSEPKKLLSKWGDATISVSRDIKNHLLLNTRLAPSQITVIENGIKIENNL